MPRRYRRLGTPGEDSLDLLSEAVSRASMTGERCYEAELHRLRGECVLSLASRNQTVAEASFQQAIEVARHQGGKMWELRGAASLARLWRRQGRCAEARDLLAPIYGWFTEGLDARDLTEARELLDPTSIDAKLSGPNSCRSPSLGQTIDKRLI